MSEISLLLKTDIPRKLELIKQSIDLMLPDLEAAQKKFAQLGGTDVTLKVDDAQIEAARREVNKLTAALQKAQATQAAYTKILSAPTKSNLKTFLDDTNQWNDSTKALIKKHEKLNSVLSNLANKRTSLAAKMRAIEKKTPTTVTESDQNMKELKTLSDAREKNEKKWRRVYARNQDMMNQIAESKQRDLSQALDGLKEKESKSDIKRHKRTEDKKTTITKKAVEERNAIEAKPPVQNRAKEKAEAARIKQLRMMMDEKGVDTSGLSDSEVQARYEKEKKAIDQTTESKKKNISTTKDLTKASENYYLTSQRVSEKMAQIRTLMEGDPDKRIQGYAKESKQYQTLKKQMVQLGKIQQQLGSDDIRIREKGLKTWQKSGHLIDDNIKKVGMMSRQIGFMNSKFAQFSIIMSGIAATLFVWQTLRQVIGSVVGVGLNLEKAMTDIKLESKLTADEFARIEENARKMGATGFMSGADYATKLQEMMAEGVPLDAAEKLLKQMQEARKALEEGLPSGALMEFKGIMSQFADALYRSADSPFVSVLKKFNETVGPFIKKLDEEGILKPTAEAVGKKMPIGLVWQNHPLIKLLRKQIPDFKPGFEPTFGPGATSKRWGLGGQSESAATDLSFGFDDLGKGVKQANIELPKFVGDLKGLDEIVRDASKAYGIQEDLIYRIIKAESDFDPKARNEKSGATGLMQVLPSTGKDMGYDDMYDIRQNVMAGTKYMAIQKKRFGSDYLASAAYNAGPEKVKKFGGVPPYAETQKYLKKIYGTDAAAGKGTAVSEVVKEIDRLGEKSMEVSGDINRLSEDALSSLPPSLVEQMTKQFSSALDAAFQLTGKVQTGQFKKQDAKANAEIVALQASGANKDVVAAVKSRQDFEREQYLLAPEMKDYEEILGKVGKTSKDYWDNERAQLAQHIEELKIRNNLSEEEIKLIEILGEKAITKRERKPHMEALDQIAAISGKVPELLKQERIKDVDTEYNKIVRTLQKFEDLPDNKQALEYARALAKMRVETNASAAELSHLKNAFIETGEASSRLKALEALKVQQTRLEAINAGVDPATANRVYQNQMDGLQQSYIDPAISAYSSLYSQAEGFSDNYYQMRLSQIEHESKQLERQAHDAVAAKRWEIKEKRRLEAERLEKQETPSDENEVINGFKAGHLRLLNESTTVSERISQSWVQGASDIASAWDSTFFDFMTLNFDNLGDSAIGIFESLRNVAIDVLNDILKQYTQKLIMSGISNLIGNSVGTSFTGTTPGYTGSPMSGALNATGVSPVRRASGGLISEPVFGIGTKSGRPYEIGESGPEMVLPLNKLGGKGGGNLNVTSPGVDIIINNNTGAEVRQQERQNPGGKRQVMVTIGNDIGAGGPTARAMERRYGLVPKGSRIYS